MENTSEISAELQATAAGAFVCRESGRGVLLVRGRDALDLLHRLSSARIDNLKDGQLRETLLTTEKGRVIDALLAVQGGEGLRLLTSAGRITAVREWLEKYTIMEDCTYSDISAATAQFSIYNYPVDSNELLPGIPLPAVGEWTSANVSGIDVEILRHRSVTGAGLRVLCPAEHAETIWSFLTEQAGVTAVGEQAFTLWRINGLIPAVGHELSEQSNPLEAGAQDAVDFRKGCFIGQEVIARLDSYDKVQRHPRRLSFSGDGAELLAVGSELRHEGDNAGFVTTVARDPLQGIVLGIGLLRAAHEHAGAVLRCGEFTVTVLA